MITTMFALFNFQYSNQSKQLDVLASEAFRSLCPTARLNNSIDKYITGNQGSYSSTVYDIGRFEVALSRRTGEVVVAAGTGDKIGAEAVTSDEMAVAQAKTVARILRPKLFHLLSFAPVIYGNSYGVRISRSIDGIPVLGNGDSRLIVFDKDKGHLQGFRFPPTEAGIHEIEKWLPESKANSTAVRFALDTFKGPTQLNFDSAKKTYVGENWFRGMPNPKHRAFTNPALKEFLFPAYVVRYINADAIRKSDQAPMQLIDVFVDAENNSIFGYTIWAAGGSGIEPAKSLDGEAFDTIKIGDKQDRKVVFALKQTQASGTPSGIAAILFAPKKAVKVLIDRTNHLVWRGKTSYQANPEFWKTLK